MLFPIIEGFDHYPSPNAGDGALNTVWNYVDTGIGAITLVAGLGGEGKALLFDSANNATDYIQQAFDPDSKVTFHFGIKITALLEPSSRPAIAFYTAGISHQFSLHIDAGGHLLLHGEGDLVVATGTTALIPNQIYRCCARADVANGRFQISINGVDDAGLNGTFDINDDPVATTVGAVRLQRWGGFGAVIHILDDFIVGTGETTDWGPQEVNTLGATADVLAQWIPSAGVTNFSNVDEALFNGDTDYNSSAVVGNKDIFDYSNPPTTPASVLAVQVLTIARKEESAVRKIKDVIRIGATDYEGNEHNLAETYGNWKSTWALNPATGIAFTGAELNALRGGYELSVVA
jgi:hypothetical protein